MNVLAFETKALSWTNPCHSHFMQFTIFHLAGFLLKRSSMNGDIWGNTLGPGGDRIPTPWALVPFYARFMGEQRAVEEHLSKTRGPLEFRQTMHMQINTAEHVLATAWKINEDGTHKECVYKEWVYPWETDRVNSEIFEPLRKSGEKHSFGLAHHKLQFRWDRKKDKQNDKRLLGEL